MFATSAELEAHLARLEARRDEYRDAGFLSDVLEHERKIADCKKALGRVRMREMYARGIERRREEADHVAGA